MSRETHSLINALNTRALQTNNTEALGLIKLFLLEYRPPIEEFNSLPEKGQMNEMNNFWIGYLIVRYPNKDTYEVRKSFQIEHSVAIYAENFIDAIVPQITTLEGSLNVQ